MSRRSPTVIWALLVALFFIGIGLWVSQFTRTNPARDYSESIARAVERVMPSVVVIRTEKINYTLRRDLFGMTYRIPEQLVGQGSGVIVDEAGHIVTSWHVIQGARAGEVVLNDGTKMPVELVGYCEATDLAVLRMRSEASSWEAAVFGNSDEARVGEVAIAIGSPFSLQSSVTVGHISQKGRKVQMLPYEDFIQTDAAINEGNSGGPLIDVDGRVIGINTAKKTDDQERGVGIAFAIPANLVQAVVDSIIEFGHHQWPWLGFSFAEVNPQVEAELESGSPVVVAQVWADSPASRAELQRGWGILSMDGNPVRTSREVERRIFNKRVGESIVLILQSGQKQKRVELTLEEFPGAI